MATPSLYFLLGASDPEMDAIMTLGRALGASIGYATIDGRRVRPDTAYQADGIDGPSLPESGMILLVECGPAARASYDWRRLGIVPRHEKEANIGVPVYCIDHHRPGDVGYDCPPEMFMRASSIGQVLERLARFVPDFAGRLGWRLTGGPSGVEPDFVFQAGRWMLRVFPWRKPYDFAGNHQDTSATFAVVPDDIVFTAAADHCLMHAYRGRCDGVNPDVLMRWRAEKRARFQQRPVDDVLRDIERARGLLSVAPWIKLSPTAFARDMRGQNVPELPEAAARAGECFISTAWAEGGLTKIVCQAGDDRQIQAFMEIWAPANGLINIYGDPARGFAGGYTKRK